MTILNSEGLLTTDVRPQARMRVTAIAESDGVRVTGSDNAGGRFRVEFDGKDVSGLVTVPDTGGWTKLQTIRIDGVRVPAGVSVMKVIMDADGASGSVGDIDCFRFSRRQ